MPTPIYIYISRWKQSSEKNYHNDCVPAEWATYKNGIIQLKVNNSRARTLFMRWGVNFYFPWASELFFFGGAIEIDKMCQINCWIISFYWLNFIIRIYSHALRWVRWWLFFALLTTFFYPIHSSILYFFIDIYTQTFTPNPLSLSSFLEALQMTLSCLLVFVRVFVSEYLKILRKD